MIPTTNVVQKTFLIMQNGRSGTAFAIENDGREYLVTARHVIRNAGAPIEILHDKKWKRLPVNGTFRHSDEPDVATITLNVQIAPRHATQTTTAGVVMGQDMTFLGFPFGWNNTQFGFNNGYPIPFVKAAALSAVVKNGANVVVYLDGHNNPGFSGGPIVADRDPKDALDSGPKIIGIVSGFPPEKTPHPSEFDPPLTSLGGFPVRDDHVHPTNSGFVKGYSIEHAVELIEANPHGFEFPT